MNSLALHDLIFANPMLEHTARRGRKYVRMCTKVVGYLRVGVAAFLYFTLIALLMGNRSSWATDLQYVEIVVITLIIQISTYAAISGERERATWESLVLSRLSVGQILAGQLLWRVAIIVALLGIFMIPLALIPAIGLEFNAPPVYLLLGAQGLIFSWAVFACALCLWISANSRRSAASAGITGVVLACLLALTPILSNLFQQGPLAGQYDLTLIFNPIHALWAHLSTHGDSTLHDYGGNDYTHASDLSDPLIDSHGFQPFWYVVAAYFLGAIACLCATHRSLRRLEEPTI